MATLVTSNQVGDLGISSLTVPAVAVSYTIFSNRIFVKVHRFAKHQYANLSVPVRQSFSTTTLEHYVNHEHAVPE